MTAFVIIALIITGLLAGVVSGTFGVGGGIIIIPALIFVLGMTQHEAQGTSLAMMIPPIGILAAMNYYKNGYVNVKYAIILVVAFLIGSYFGSLLSVHIPEKILKKLFAVLIIAVGIKMFFNK